MVDNVTDETNILSSIHDIPPELIQQFIINLSYDDIINFCESSPQFNAFCEDHFFWNSKALNDFPHLKPYLDMGFISLETPKQDYRLLAGKEQVPLNVPPMADYAKYTEFNGMDIVTKRNKGQALYLLFEKNSGANYQKFEEVVTPAIMELDAKEFLKWILENYEKLGADWKEDMESPQIYYVMSGLLLVLSAMDNGSSEIYRYLTTKYEFEREKLENILDIYIRSPQEHISTINVDIAYDVLKRVNFNGHYMNSFFNMLIGSSTKFGKFLGLMEERFKIEPELRTTVLNSITPSLTKASYGKFWKTTVIIGIFMDRYDPDAKDA